MAKRRGRMGGVVMMGMVDVMVNFIAILFMTMNQGKAEVQAQTYKLQQSIDGLEAQKVQLKADIKELDSAKKAKVDAAAAEAQAEADKAKAEADAKAQADREQAEAMAQAEADQRAREAQAQAAADRAEAEYQQREAAYKAQWASSGQEPRVTAADGDRNYDAVLFVGSAGVYSQQDGLGGVMTDQKKIQAWVQALLDSYDPAYDSDHTLSLAIWVYKGGNDKVYSAVDAVKAVDQSRKITLFITPSDNNSGFHITSGGSP